MWLSHRGVFFHLSGLAKYTPRGYITGSGIAPMVEEDRYCIDILTQIAAVRAAIRRVHDEIMRDHVAHCVSDAIASSDKANQRRKIAELMDVFARADT